MPHDNAPPPSRTPPPMPIERLYVLWLISSSLLLLLVIVIALLGSGHLRRQAESVSALTQTVEDLRHDRTQAREELADLRAAVEAARRAAARATAFPTTQPGQTKPAQEQPPPPAGGQAEPSSEAALTAVLERAIRPAGPLAYALVDRAGADSILREALRAAPQAAWDGETWARLAVLARLLGHDDLAASLAERATRAGVFPGAYTEVATRQMLAARHAAEAVALAGRLVRQQPADPRGPLLLAQAHLLQNDSARALAALDGLHDPQQLTPADRLRLGEVFVALDQGRQLDDLLASLGPLPDAALPERNYLRAVADQNHGQLAEALAILDDLLAQPLPAAADYPVPDEYDLRTWRGAVLARARQFDAARQALRHAEQFPDRPQAWYWRGVVEMQAGNEDAAVGYFQKALAAAGSFAPAWEALGTLALNHGDVASAAQDFQNAAAANPRRASAQFLLAIALAKADQRPEAERSLRAALQLDPALLETARQTPALMRMFRASELEALGQGADDKTSGGDGETTGRDGKAGAAASQP